jgi:uncharacterized protein (TIGR02246 family)
LRLPEPWLSLFWLGGKEQVTASNYSSKEEFTMRSLFPAIVFALGSLSFSNVNQINAQSQEDEAAIRQAVATMATAFNTRDDQVTASLMTGDADFVTVTGAWSKSSADYLAARRARFATALKNASIRVVDIKIRFLRPDVALAHVTQEIRGMLDSDGKELPLHTELSLRVFVREHGKWLMTAFHNTAVTIPTESASKRD